MRRKNSYYTICKNQSEEFEWLYKKQLPDALKAELVKCGLNSIMDTVVMNNQVITFAQINNSLSKKTMRSLSTWQVENVIFIEIKRLMRLLIIKAKVKIKFSSRFYNIHRSFENDGPIVVVIGIDGAGKSTIIRKCHNIISKKIDCDSVYFGHGKSGGKLYRLLFLFCVALSRIMPFCRSKIHGIRVLCLRFLAARKIKQAYIKGKFVLVDRWPQISHKVSDGPIFDKKSGALNMIEEQINKYINSLPICLISLDISVPLAMKRKINNESALLDKQIAINSAQYLGTVVATKNIQIAEGTSTDHVISEIFTVINDTLT